MKFRDLITSPKAAFQYRKTNPLLAIMQALIVLLITISLPIYTVLQAGSYVESEVYSFKEYFFYDAEETTCKIESYIFTCDSDDETEYTVPVNSDASEVYIFTKDSLEYAIGGITLLAETYVDLGVSDLELESLRQSYSNTTYKGITTMLEGFYDSNSIFINTLLVTSVFMSSFMSFALMIFILTFMSSFSNKGQIRTGIGDRLSVPELITMTCYSTFIPSIIITIAYLFTGSYMSNLLLFGTGIVSVIALNANKKKL